MPSSPAPLAGCDEPSARAWPAARQTGCWRRPAGPGSSDFRASTRPNRAAPRAMAPASPTCQAASRPRPAPGAIFGSGRTPMFYLLANNGPQAGRKYELKGDKWILGRHPDCDVVIEVGAVSRNHCQIVREGNAYRLEDLGSRNGTFVND